MTVESRDVGGPPSGGDPVPSGTELPGSLFADVLERLNRRSGSFSRYEIESEVARGGMGAILRVRDVDLRRVLAMKVVLNRGDVSNSPEATQTRARLLGRFLDEAQVTGQLDHPGIVPVHELGLDREGRVYFTMRLVAGRDLEKIFELVRRGEEDWSTTRAVGALLKVCEAVAYAHSKGVVHRDLKPANVMVGRFGEVYVMDWGLARVLDRGDGHDVRPKLDESPERPREVASGRVRTDRHEASSPGSSSPLATMDGDIIGTPAYMSPEQARGALDLVDATSDVYAAGAILYHLLAGHMPYVLPGSGLDAIDTWRRVRDGPPEPLHERAPKAPVELVAICEKAMERERANRYPSMQALADDLRAWLEGRVVRAYETGALAEARKWILRNKGIAYTVTAAIVVIVAGTSTAAFVLANKNEQLSSANVRIQKSEKEAVANAAIAEERARRILRLSDVKRLEELRRSADRLWPAVPATVAAYEAWLHDARDLEQRLPEHAAALEGIRARATAPGAVLAGSGASEFTFPTAEERWQHDTQAELVEGLRAFAEPAAGTIADVEKRAEFARTIEERSTNGPEASALWAAAIASIGDLGECPAYRGLRLTPQLGLLPIGRDPDSGLWEFAYLQTGAAPQRDASSGTIAVDEESALVLVLLPGGRFVMGAQSGSRDEDNYDPQAIDNEQPVHEVELEPFFVSKYEMTQGQWERFTGRNPSVYAPGIEIDDREMDRTHPVEKVSWTECDETLRRLGLALPTEAQWEYAARGGTSTPWWTGAEKETLLGAANLADQSGVRVGAQWPGIADWPGLDDGWAVHAPVGEYRPNPFGLYGVTGNVWEWCRDWYTMYEDPVRGVDGERPTEDHRWRVSRGGGHTHEASFARSAKRNNSSPETSINHLGVRPSRALDP